MNTRELPPLSAYPPPDVRRRYAGPLTPAPAPMPAPRPRTSGPRSAVAAKVTVVAMGLLLVFLGVASIGASVMISPPLAPEQPLNDPSVTTGTVREIVLTRTELPGNACRPIAEFAVGGTTYEATATHSVLDGVAGCPWTVGSSAEIEYLPEDIEGTARVRSPMTGIRGTAFTIGNAGFVIGGILAIVGGALLVVYGIRMRPLVGE